MLPEWQASCAPSGFAPSWLHAKVGRCSGMQPPFTQTLPVAHLLAGHASTQWPDTHVVPFEHSVVDVHGAGFSEQTPRVPSHL